MSQAKFLCSDVSGTDIDGRNKSSRNSFARYMVTYGKNGLQPRDAKRLCDVKYHEIEKKLVQYVDLRSRLFKIDGKVLSWNIIVAKCEQWAQQEEDPKYKSFKASVGFISKALKRNNIDGLHGEGNELSDEEGGDLITKFKEDELHDFIRVHFFFGLTFIYLAMMGSTNMQLVTRDLMLEEKQQLLKQCSLSALVLYQHATLVQG
jgi:hypothetical protein